MRKYFVIVAIAAVIGLSTGMAFAEFSQDESYCEKVEQQIRDREKVGGAVACVDPSATDINISEEASAGLKCSCMILQNGEIQFVNVGTA
ncbi:MAG: hypothetical protein ACLFTA_03405 [Candidatus Nanohaloarchaea archaeon]